jgi:hypothetical protein
LRGFDEKKGWIHATAHTADLLAELSRNEIFTKNDQAQVLAAIAHRLATADEIYINGGRGDIFLRTLVQAIEYSPRRT